MRAFLLALAAVAAAAPAWADYAQDRANCSGYRLPLPGRVEACTRVLTALDASPDIKAEAFYQRGNALTGLGKHDDAIADFDKAIAIDAHRAEIFSARGSAHVAKRDYAKAVADFDAAIELRPAHARTYLLRGAVHYRLRRPQKALEDFDAAVQREPENREYLHARGRVLTQLKQWDRAIADFDRILANDRFRAVAFLSRAVAYEGKGNRTRALHDYGIAVLLDPNLRSAADAVARLVPKRPPAPPAEPIAFAAPIANLRVAYLQIDTKARPERSDMELAIDELVGWFARPPLPRARRGVLFDLLVGAQDGSVAIVRQTRKAAFPELRSPPEQALGFYRTLWPYVVPGPFGQRMVIGYRTEALDALWPLAPRKTATGDGMVYVPACPPGDDPIRAALACPAEQRTQFGTVKWKAEMLRWEYVTVPAGGFTAAVVRYEEDADLTAVGRNVKRKTVTHFWYAPEIKWWVKRTTESQGEVTIAEALEIE